MKGWVGWALLAISLMVAIAGWRNAQPEPETETLSRQWVCESATGPCAIQGTRPAAVATDFTSRRYQWATSGGPMTVTCRREYVFAGAWHCTPSPGEIAK